MEVPGHYHDNTEASLASRVLPSTARGCLLTAKESKWDEKSLQTQSYKGQIQD
jgi:hypothetical protein